MPQQRRSSIALEAIKWQPSRIQSETASPVRETSSGSTRWKGSRRLTAAPSWLVAAGIGVEKAELQDEPLEDQRKKREIFHAVVTVCLVVTVIVQSALLDMYFLDYYKTWLPYLWIIPDFFCIAVFVAAQTLSYRYLLHSHFGASHVWLNSMFPSAPAGEAHGNKCSTYLFGVLPLSYISWLIYSTILLAKLLIIVVYVAETLKSRDFLGFQSFQVTVALAALVFFCLVEGHTWATRTSHRYIFVTMVCAYTALDLIDTVNLMSLLSVSRGDKYEFTEKFETFVAVCCSVSFVLPTVSLYLLSMTDRTAEVLELPVTTFNDVIHLTLLDIPYLIIRVYWLASGDSSVFILLMKNVFFIIVTIRRIVPDAQEMVRHYRYTRKALRKIHKKREEHQLEKGLGGSDAGPGTEQGGHPPAPSPAPAPAAATGDAGAKAASAKGAHPEDASFKHKSNIAKSIMDRGHDHRKGIVYSTGDDLGGITDETRRGTFRGSHIGDPESPAVLEDKHQPEEDGLHADAHSLSSLSLSTLSTLTSSEEVETANVGTQTEGAYSFPIPPRPRYPYPSRSKAGARGRGIESRRRERERELQIDEEFEGENDENRDLSEEPPAGSHERQSKTWERGGRGTDRRGGAHSRPRRGTRRRNRGYKSPGRGLEGRGRDVERRRRGYGSPGRGREGHGRYIERGERRHGSPERGMERLGRDNGRRDRGYKSPARREAGRERNIERGDREHGSPGRGLEGQRRDRERRERGQDGRGQGLQGQGRNPEGRGENRAGRREAGEGRGRDQERQRQDPEESGRRRGRQEDNEREQGGERRQQVGDQERQRQDPEERGRRRGRQEDNEREQGGERRQQVGDARERSSDERRDLGRRARDPDEHVRIREPARDSPLPMRPAWR